MNIILVFYLQLDLFHRLSVEGRQRGGTSVVKSPVYCLTRGSHALGQLSYLDVTRLRPAQQIARGKHLARRCDANFARPGLDQARGGEGHAIQAAERMLDSFAFPHDLLIALLIDEAEF